MGVFQMLSFYMPLAKLTLLVGLKCFKLTLGHGASNERRKRVCVRTSLDLKYILKCKAKSINIWLSSQANSKNKWQNKTHRCLIDKLTNSIVNTISGDNLPTEVIEVTTQDLKLVTKTRVGISIGIMELKKENTKVFKLTVINNPEIIQGLISFEDKGDHIFVNLVENAPFNIGKKNFTKVYLATFLLLLVN